MKHLFINVIIFFAILCLSLYYLGNKQVAAKQNYKIKPEVDLHFTWQDLYVGFYIENASLYNQIEYQIKYNYSGDLIRVVEGSIDNSSGLSSIDRENIILGSESTGGTHSYDNVTSPITLTVNFSKSSKKFISTYSVTKTLNIPQ